MGTQGRQAWGFPAYLSWLQEGAAGLGLLALLVSAWLSLSAQGLSQGHLGGWRPRQAPSSVATLVDADGQQQPCPAPSSGLVPLGGPALATAVSAPLRSCRVGGASPGPPSKVAVWQVSAQVRGPTGLESQRPNDKPPAAGLCRYLLACC